MKKINLEVTCKLNCFGYWNSCKCLPNFVNVAALYRSGQQQHLLFGCIRNAVGSND